MGRFVKICKRLGQLMNAISEVTVYLMMLLTVTDVTMRFFSKPILGSYELVSIIGAIVIAFALPKTSLEHGHVYVDFLLVKFSHAAQRITYVCTRIPSIAFFIALTLFLALKGRALYRAAEVTSTLQIPRYYLVYALAFCCLVECIVLVADIGMALENDGGNRDE